MAYVLESVRPTFNIYVQGAAPISASFNLAIIESGASPAITKLRRIIIWNPGNATAAQKTNFSIYRETTASSAGTAFTPIAHDSSDTAFTGVARITNPTAGTLGANPIYRFSLFTPAALAAFTPLVFDFTNNNLTKGLIIPTGITNGLLFRADNGAAGYANLDFTIELTEE